jgi:histone deacetylase 11
MLHVVYDPTYNVEELAPVGCRYRAIFEELQARLVPTVHSPQPFDPVKTHTSDYIESLKDPEVVREIFELDSPCSQQAVDALLVSQKAQYAGTVTAVDLALEHGFAINLGGGLHHASRNAGSGFCLFNDITAAVEHLLSTGKARRILIIDLDAHQGNGYEEDLWEHCQRGQVCIFDAYEPMIFPFPAGEAVKQSIHYYIPYMKEDRGDCFIDYLLKGIALPFDEFQPDFVIYNAGTDTLEGDPVTRLSQTAEAIQDRDFIVVETCRSAGIPVVMCLSGGYGEAVPRVVAESLCRLT